MVQETSRILVQGIVISKIPCNLERVVFAQRNNLALEKVPLKYGSLRLAVNIISMFGRTYRINKRSTSENIKEERLILETSYRFDSKLTSIVPEHNIINDINVGDTLSLSLNRTFLTNKHYCKLILTGRDKYIKTYFLKAWANDIELFSDTDIKVGRRKITPPDVIKRLDTTNVLQLT